MIPHWFCNWRRLSRLRSRGWRLSAGLLLWLLLWTNAKILMHSHHVHRKSFSGFLLCHLCHELAHVVLEHEFGVSLSADERKCGLGGEQEDEADWLSGEMLIPYDGAFRLARANATDQQAADLFDVSLAVARWRMNHTGVRKIVERTRNKWAKSRNAQHK